MHDDIQPAVTPSQLDMQSSFCPALPETYLSYILELSGSYRMPTLAGVHSSQGTISLEMRPLQQGTVQGMSTDRQSPNDLMLDHSRLHLLLCPWKEPLHQVLQALAGSKQASKAVGKHWVSSAGTDCCNRCKNSDSTLDVRQSLP